MRKAEIERKYQWCYYGASDLLINRISIPVNFSKQTAPPGCTGLCVEGLLFNAADRM